MGWTEVQKTARCALQRFELFTVLCAAADWVKKGSCHTAWSVPSTSSCSCSYANGHGTAVGPQTGERCWPLLVRLWRAIAPLMKPWCAEEDVQTAANLNLYRGWKSRVGWHCDDEPLRVPELSRARPTPHKRLSDEFHTFSSRRSTPILLLGLLDEFRTLNTRISGTGRRLGGFSERDIALLYLLVLRSTVCKKGPYFALASTLTCCWPGYCGR